MATTYNVNDIIYIINENNATVIGCVTTVTSLTSSLKSTTADISFQIPPGTEYKITIVTLTIPSRVEINNTMYNVREISDNAFIIRKDLTVIIIPDSVTTIGKNAFSGCSSLVSVIIGNSVTTIGTGAFSDCTSLVSIKIPYSVTAILNRTFYGCTGLTSIIIPNLNTTIEPTAFDSCTSLARFYKI